MTRYDPIQLDEMGGKSRGEMEARPDGDYVRYEDAAKLLAALEGMLAYYDRHGSKNSEEAGIRIEARAAIAKATE